MRNTFEDFKNHLDPFIIYYDALSREYISGCIVKKLKLRQEFVYQGVRCTQSTHTWVDKMKKKVV